IVERDRRCDTSRPRPGMSRATRSHQPARPWTVIGIVLLLVMPRGPSAASLSRYVVALEAEASTGAHTEPPNWLGERPGRLLPEGTQIDRSIGRSVLLFQAVLRRLARPTA